MEETCEAKIERIKRELASVPAASGVYLWKDSQGDVIYIGKAKQLRARMRQYVNLQDSRIKIPLLVEAIDSFEYIVTKNEHESLILEKNLINQYAPFFNADFKDDKSYPFIALTQEDVFPAIKYTREKHNSKTRYFGPYTDSRAARTMLDTARRVVPICSASCAEWRRIKRKFEKAKREDWASICETHRPCFDAHMGLGPGVCCGKISPDEYWQHVSAVEDFLNGKRKDFILTLEKEMDSAAEELNFERAARIKQRIDAINSLSDKQNAITLKDLNADVVGIYREETIAGVHVFVVREGRIINSNEFILNKGKNVPTDDLIRAFLFRYYEVTHSIPQQLIVREIPQDAPLIADWLTEKLASVHGAKVRFVTPQRGEKLELLKLAERNASHTLMRYKVHTNYDDSRINDALLQLESALALPKPPYRIECFDISTIHGSYTVASMVVFTNGKPDKSQYRRFKIKTPLDEANDFLSMKEIISRRYRKSRLEDKRFGAKPDLVILDGGKPQLSAALEGFKALGIDDISLCGLAKRDEEVFVPWQDDVPVVLPSGSASLYLIKYVRDEAHRFAITFHRELRGKGMTASILDEVVGLGPVGKKALLKAFGSFKNLRDASLEEIQACGVLSEKVAQETFMVLRQYNQSRQEKREGLDRHGSCKRNAKTSDY